MACTKLRAFGMKMPTWSGPTAVRESKTEKNGTTGLTRFVYEAIDSQLPIRLVEILPEWYDIE